jgi:hypothetical protein
VPAATSPPNDFKSNFPSVVANSAPNRQLSVAAQKVWAVRDSDPGEPVCLQESLRPDRVTSVETQSQSIPDWLSEEDAFDLVFGRAAQQRAATIPTAFAPAAWRTTPLYPRHRFLLDPSSFARLPLSNSAMASEAASALSQAPISQGQGRRVRPNDLSVVAYEPQLLDERTFPYTASSLSPAIGKFWIFQLLFTSTANAKELLANHNEHTTPAANASQGPRDPAQKDNVAFRGFSCSAADSALLQASVVRP